MSESSSSEFQWILHGNVVVPTGNPFDPQHAVPEHDMENEEWLGNGLKLCLDHVILVNQRGIIEELAHESHFPTMDQFRSNPHYIRLSPHAFLVPGFIDLHIHAPQYSYTGTATDRPLMGPDGWLETYTFPAERRLENLQRAQQVYQGVVQTTLRAGTTTAVYFATLHVEPCQVLVDLCLNLGQRAFVGKVCMDRNSPEDYVQSLEQNVAETERLIQYIHKKAGSEQKSANLPLVLPVVTPRFIPTCTPQLMSALGDLAVQYNCHVQSHLSESIDEVEFSRQLDLQDDGGNGRTDAEIFHAYRLLTDRCIMAHSVYMSESDMDLVKRQKSGVAHCPLSNFFFAGNSLPCRKLLERGNLVGLGTDVAGGYSPSMMNSARMAVVASQALQHEQLQRQCKTCGKEKVAETTRTTHVIDYRHAFYLATLGGAEALGLQDRIGTFQLGMEFDALIVSPEKTPIQIYDTDTCADVFQKICTLGDDRTVKRVFVQGRDVTVAAVDS